MTISVITLCGCNFYGDVNLGNGYFLWRDGGYREVIYCFFQEKDEGGYSLMHENVLSYSVSDSLIFIKTINANVEDSEAYDYFMIKKKYLNIKDCENQHQIDSVFKTIIIPLKDSNTFYQLLSINKLSLVK